MRSLLLFLLLPSCLFAQENNDYLKLIREDSSALPPGDSARDIRLSPLRLSGRNYFYSNIKAVRIRNGQVEFVPVRQLRLGLAGTYAAGYTMKRAGAGPALQQTYAQGRSSLGSLAWRGAETGEMFSYGPLLSSLEFDGGAYAYDANGRLVPAGAGNGMPAKAYGNGILRHGSLFTQSFTLLGDLDHSARHLLNFNLRLAEGKERLIVPENRNTNRQLDAKVTAFLYMLELRGAYLLHEDKFSNSSRNGFLQKAYMNSLLTPASFNNHYGKAMPAYGSNADNPLFLLENNGHYYHRRQQQGSLGAILTRPYFKLKAVQSYEEVNEHADESYKPGSAGFPAGAITVRNKRDRTYFLQSEARYFIEDGIPELNMEASLLYVFTDNHSATAYRFAATGYDYQRSAGNLTLQYDLRYNGGKAHGGVELGAVSYFSNTASGSSWFSPSLNGYFRYNNYNRLELKANLTYRQTATELPVNNSLAYANMLRYAVQEAGRYLPNTEASGFDGLGLTRVRAWNAVASVSYDQWLRFSAEWFRQHTLQDVFPFLAAGGLELRNAGNHLRKGMELEAEVLEKGGSRLFATSHILSFTSWKHKVTAINNGNDYTPLAGFSDVYKVMAAGQPFGSIMGSTWLRDAAGNRVIGTDGFPLTDPALKIIGNPVPDFVVKLANNLRYKKLKLSTAAEWRKGGDVWNGTAAVLDYYGRSAKSAALRDTRDYIFPGVTVDGHPNATPVRFYDPAQPLEQNRWVRYGYGGVAEDYIEKGDCIRLQYAELSYYWNLKKFIRKVTLSASVGNIILWKAYSGSDPEQLLFDQPNTAGLDFFQLPSLQTYGLQFSFQF
jgi:hypothetical protein